jgi:hypothetical protein
MEVVLIKYEVVSSLNYYNFTTLTYIFTGVLIITSIITVSLWRTRKGLRWKCVAVSVIIFMFYSVVSNVYTHFKLVNDLKKNNCKIEEGLIKDFSPASNNVKSIETFSINNNVFKYAITYENGGLNHSISDNNLIHDGSYAKVYYEDDNTSNGYKVILRIEVKKN